MMTRYRKRPVVVEAWRNDDEMPRPAWVDVAAAGVPVPEASSSSRPSRG